MRILVTGANGRLGSQIVQQLQETQVDTVTGIDIDNVNITDSASVQQLFESVKPELVIHCAALTAVDYCAEHPDEALAVNGMGTQIMAQMCQSTDAAMLFVSTNEVFDGKERRTYLEY